MTRRSSRLSRQRTARGVRNNNPLNIRHLPPERAWRGQKPQPDAPGGFGVYETPEDGIRAAILQITRHIDRGNNTLQSLIAVWAPAAENDTGRYVAVVADELAMRPDEPIDSEDGELILAIAQAMARHENGSIPYDDATWRRGLTAAGLGEPPRSSLASSRTMGGAAIGGGASVAGLASTMMSSIDQNTAIAGVQAIMTGPNTIMMVCAAVTLACAAYTAYARWTDWKDGYR